MYRETGIESPEFIRAALVKGSYKQNLFLDGYIRLSADGKVGTFNDYIRLILPDGIISRASFDKAVSQNVLHVIEISDLDGFDKNDWGDIEDAKTEIQKKRKERGTYRSQFQIESEAEVRIFINNLGSGKYSVDGLERVERAYFVSQSQIIDQAFQQDTVTTWTPESLYRYLSTLPGREIDPNLLQQCMLHEYYYAGISFIDKDRYEHFFGPSINAAKASYKKERDSYIEEIEETYAEDIDAAFEQTPDLEKPFFVAQMGWKLAEASKHKEETSRQREELATKRALDAEIKVKELEAERDNAWKIREKKKQEQEAARLRNLQDPKHVRKRRRQAKKRKRKKK